MRRVHLILGLLGVVIFLITGQLMKHHNPPVRMLTPDLRMMYVSRHIYRLGTALVNLVLGLYLREYSPGWRRALQRIGSVLIFLSVLSLLMAFISEPSLGLAGRSWRSYFGLIGLFAGVMTHLVAAVTGET
jgi:MFS family permease